MSIYTRTMFGGPPPPPSGGPPPPPANNFKAPPKTKGRAQLLGDIHKGAKLKKAVTVDKSAPVLEKRTYLTLLHY